MSNNIEIVICKFCTLRSGMSIGIIFFYVRDIGILFMRPFVDFRL